MATINMFRGFLVAGAVLAAIIAAAYGQWAAVGILTVGIVAHGLLWVKLHRDRSVGPQPPASAP